MGSELSYQVTCTGFIYEIGTFSASSKEVHEKLTQAYCTHDSNAGELIGASFRGKPSRNTPNL
ncbi:MAG: hypothetical protein JMN25_00330 [gamma proteobacterium endosymbiont of Lamellibrachia anaximandri]|nr:hypothetical protein [gamma proteobacterium endosymbiont of Lamellibrachia anaximandri]